MSDDDLYRRAAQRADDKIGFYKHLASFIVVNVILAIINFLTGNGELWFFWITGLWGIGLIGHFVKVFIVNGKLDDNREDMIKKEMEKMKK
jgi:hypothetical protein